MFYSTQIEAESIWLSQEETNHCKNVLRIKIGENVQVTNGKGNLYDCKLTDYTKKGAQLHINNSNYYENNISKNLHIGIAPTKSADRIEWFVEKAVEIGIGKISLVMMQHSERKHISLERINKVAISAMKQSLQVYLPEIDVFNDIKSFIKTVENYPVKITAHLLQSLQNPINKVIN
ncbi:MAG: RsmE family RNA methyltransferase, partial [Bacteroidota bacterium]|nr:RsmE family RNA methyltransferase [Bacteroidota bacterium]